MVAGATVGREVLGGHDPTRTELARELAQLLARLAGADAECSTDRTVEGIKGATKKRDARRTGRGEHVVVDDERCAHARAVGAGDLEGGVVRETQVASQPVDGRR